MSDLVPLPSTAAEAPIEGKVMDDSRWEVIDWADIDYLARVKSDGYGMDFEVYEVAGRVVDSDVILFETADARSSSDTTDDVTQAAPLFHGRVKWDGCSDWAWNTDRVMWHGCGWRNVVDLTEAMKRTFALAADRIDHWDAEPGR
jgi:hypothetical protein